MSGFDRLPERQQQQRDEDDEGGNAGNEQRNMRTTRKCFSRRLGPPRRGRAAAESAAPKGGLGKLRRKKTITPASPLPLPPSMLEVPLKRRAKYRDDDDDHNNNDHDDDDNDDDNDDDTKDNNNSNNNNNNNNDDQPLPSRHLSAGVLSTKRHRRDADDDSSDDDHNDNNNNNKETRTPTTKTAPSAIAAPAAATTTIPQTAVAAAADAAVRRTATPMIPTGVTATGGEAVKVRRAAATTSALYAHGLRSRRGAAAGRGSLTATTNTRMPTTKRLAAIRGGAKNVGASDESSTSGAHQTAETAVEASTSGAQQTAETAEEASTSGAQQTAEEASTSRGRPAEAASTSGGDPAFCKVFALYANLIFRVLYVTSTKPHVKRFLDIIQNELGGPQLTLDSEEAVQRAAADIASAENTPWLLNLEPRFDKLFGAVDLRFLNCRTSMYGENQSNVVVFLTTLTGTTHVLSTNAHCIVPIRWRDMIWKASMSFRAESLYYEVDLDEVMYIPSFERATVLVLTSKEKHAIRRQVALDLLSNKCELVKISAAASIFCELIESKKKEEEEEEEKK